MPFRHAERAARAPPARRDSRRSRRRTSMGQGPLYWSEAAVTRRSLLKYGLAAGATLSLADLIAACGNSSPSVATGKRADHIIYGGGVETSINPLETLGHSESYWAWDALTYVDPTKGGAISPRL